MVATSPKFHTWASGVKLSGRGTDGGLMSYEIIVIRLTCLMERARDVARMEMFLNSVCIYISPFGCIAGREREKKSYFVLEGKVTIRKKEKKIPKVVKCSWLAVAPATVQESKKVKRENNEAIMIKINVTQS